MAFLESGSYSGINLDNVLLKISNKFTSSFSLNGVYEHLLLMSPYIFNWSFEIPSKRIFFLVFIFCLDGTHILPCMVSIFCLVWYSYFALYGAHILSCMVWAPFHFKLYLMYTNTVMISRKYIWIVLQHQAGLAQPYF